MKKLLLTIVCAQMALAAYAQDSISYTFSRTTETYANLTGAVVLTDNTDWDRENWEIPVGFSFKSGPYSSDSLTISDDGNLILTEGEEGIVIISAMGADLTPVDLDDATSSPISYKLDGMAGSRILKIEWRNVSFFETLDPDNNYVNFQIWLYEGSNKIEMKYGTSEITDPIDWLFEDGGPVVGVGYENDTTSKMWLLSGNPASPTLTTNEAQLNDVPAANTVYSFQMGTPAGVSKLTVAQPQVSVYPNPVQDQLNVRVEQSVNGTIELYSLSGQRLMQQRITGKNNSLSISSLSEGVYVLTITTPQGVEQHRIVKR